MYNDGRFKVWGAMFNAGIKDPKAYIKKMYLDGNSCNKIAEHLFTSYNITTSVRNINNYVKNMGIMRDYSSAKKIAIKNGRIVYKKKSKEEMAVRLSLGVKKRMEILERDKFKCTICGNGKSHRYSIEVHHKDFDPKNNSDDNLITVCWLCHKGLHG